MSAKSESPTTKSNSTMAAELSDDEAREVLEHALSQATIPDAEMLLARQFGHLEPSEWARVLALLPPGSDRGIAIRLWQNGKRRIVKAQALKMDAANNQPPPQSEPTPAVGVRRIKGRWCDCGTLVDNTKQSPQWKRNVDVRRMKGRWRDYGTFVDNSKQIKSTQPPTEMSTPIIASNDQLLNKKCEPIIPSTSQPATPNKLPATTQLTLKRKAEEALPPIKAASSDATPTSGNPHKKTKGSPWVTLGTKRINPYHRAEPSDQVVQQYLQKSDAEIDCMSQASLVVAARELGFPYTYKMKYKPVHTMRVDLKKRLSELQAKGKDDQEMDETTIEDGASTEKNGGQETSDTTDNGDEGPVDLSGED